MAIAALAVTVGVLVQASATASAAVPPVPEQIVGEVVYIPYPVDIAVDGDLSDWAGLEQIYVDYGPEPSKKPGENDSFTFSVASDGTHLYLAMTMPDENIVTGRHGSDWWDEDSLEFYFNFTDNLDAPNFTNGIHQVRMLPYNIGNTDPDDFVLNGAFAGAIDPRAIVFATDDGWGFEASVVIPETYAVAHGAAIGFQAQANGAAINDRNVKLIWSLRDENDDSWQNPAVFGTGVFFELGSDTVPSPPERGSSEVALEIPEPGIGVNQLGYTSDRAMRAAFVSSASGPQVWVLRDPSGEVVAEGTTDVWGPDRTAGGTVHLVDLAGPEIEGDSFTIESAGMASTAFALGEADYGALAAEALAYYYRNRSGVELLAEFAGDEWARPAGHLSDADIGCFDGEDDAGREWPGCAYRLDGSKGWYDAGDYGKYVVNGGISVWTLMNLYERFGAFGDGSMSIPESANGVPDILEEARGEMEFLLGMQVPEGEPMAGMAHHKLHDRQWAPLPSLPATYEINDPSSPTEGSGRYVYPPSTTASLNLAATGAQCARVFASYDATFAQRCLSAAERAWSAAEDFPKEYTGSVPGSGGGPYHDGGTFDEWYWAAAELYATTGADEYLTVMRDSRFHGLVVDEGPTMSWGSTSLLGTITTALVGVDEQLSAEALETITANADRLVALSDSQGFGPALDDFVWGSNSDLLNNAIVLALAHDLTGDPEYRRVAETAVDYVLGVNPVGMSYVTGIGSPSPQHPHHRFWANRDEWPPAPAGVLVGGPNATADDVPANAASVRSLPEARRYIDHIESYSTNEVTINWNAPLAWMATWMAHDEAAAPLPETSGSSDTTPLAWVLAGAVMVAVLAVGVVAIKRGS
ncbi:MAG: glycoside hydrolase family 9 protein [Acidimicrobiia bacterium]